MNPCFESTMTLRLDGGSEGSGKRKAPAMRGLSVGEREWKDSNLQPPVS